MTLELTQADRARLDEQRIEYLRHKFPCLLVGVTIARIASDQSLVLVVEPGKVNRLRSKLADLRWAAYLICGAERLSIYEGESLLLCTVTVPLLVESVGISKVRSKLGKSEQSKDFNPMTVAAPVKPQKTSTRRSNSKQSPKNKSTKSTASTSSSSMNLQDRIANFAQKTGQSAETIALSLIGQLPTETIEQGFINLADAHLTQLRNELIGIGGNGATATAATVETTPDTNGTTAPTETKERKSRSKPAMRFNAFEVKRSRTKTIGSFLDAQNLAPEDRVKFIEDLAALPVEQPRQPEALETMAEVGLKKILSAYPKASRPSRADMIKSAKTMIGSTTNPDSSPSGES